jgi:hypothetical protein
MRREEILPENAAGFSNPSPIPLGQQTCVAKTFSFVPSERAKEKAQ